VLQFVKEIYKIKNFYSYALSRVTCRKESMFSNTPEYESPLKFPTLPQFFHTVII